MAIDTFFVCFRAIENSWWAVAVGVTAVGFVNNSPMDVCRGNANVHCSQAERHSLTSESCRTAEVQYGSLAPSLDRLPTVRNERARDDWFSYPAGARHWIAGWVGSCSKKPTEQACLECGVITDQHLTVPCIDGLGSERGSPSCGEPLSSLLLVSRPLLLSTLNAILVPAGQCPFALCATPTTPYLQPSSPPITAPSFSAATARSTV